MSYDGFYINLDRSAGRRTAVEKELARCGLGGRYRRFTAIDGTELPAVETKLTSGERGCFMSHHALLKENSTTGRHMHVIEDDVVFSTETAGVINRLIDAGALDTYDILYADIPLRMTNDAYRDFKNLYDKTVMRDGKGGITGSGFHIIEHSPLMGMAADSYIVSEKAISKIVALMDEEVGNGLRVPVDAFLIKAVRAGILKAGFVFPFITSIRLSDVMHSTVREVADTTLRFTASTLARYSFFIGCDFDECARIMRHIPQPPASDKQAQILSHILAFTLTLGKDTEARPEVE